MINNEWLKDNASLVTLPDNSAIYQHKQGQKVSTDNEFFTNFIRHIYERKGKQVTSVLEIGAGNGINLFMIKKHFPNWLVTGIELDAEQVKLAKYNSLLQKLELTMFLVDLKEFQAERKFDLILVNPPYQKIGQGRMSPYTRTNMAKFELSTTIEEVVKCIKRNLSPLGKAFIMYTKARFDELMKIIKEHSFLITDTKEYNKVIIIGIQYARD